MGKIMTVTVDIAGIIVSFFPENSWTGIDVYRAVKDVLGNYHFKVYSRPEQELKLSDWVYFGRDYWFTVVLF